MKSKSLEHVHASTWEESVREDAPYQPLHSIIFTEWSATNYAHISSFCSVTANKTKTKSCLKYT